MIPQPNLLHIQPDWRPVQVFAAPIQQSCWQPPNPHIPTHNVGWLQQAKS